MEKGINYKFKFLYVIGIITVLAGHCSGGGISIFYEWFTPYAFHLGLFMFSSGYFYKPSDEKCILNAILLKIKRLVVPLYAWNAFYGILVQLLKFKGFTIGGELNLYNLIVAPWTDGHQFMYNLGGWYIAPLFMIYIINLLLKKLFGKYINNYIFEIIYIICGMLGVYAAICGYNTGIFLIFSRIAYFIPFYGLGMLYRSNIEGKFKIKNIYYFGVIFIIQLMVITIYGGVKSCTPSWCTGFGDVISPFLTGVLGIAFWLRIAKILSPILPKCKNICVIADNAYTIMINQFLGFMIVTTGWAIIYKISHGVILTDFSWEAYKTNLWYRYVPQNLIQWHILYVVVGIIIPIFMKKILEMIKNIFIRGMKNTRKYIG